RLPASSAGPRGTGQLDDDDTVRLRRASRRLAQLRAAPATARGNPTLQCRVPYTQGADRLRPMVHQRPWRTYRGPASMEGEYDRPAGSLSHGVPVRVLRRDPAAVEPGRAVLARTVRE